MKNFIYAVLFFLSIPVLGFSQSDSLSLKIVNQYESEIPVAKIIVIGTGKEYETDLQGNVTIASAKTDSIKIIKRDYDADAISLIAIQKNNIIAVNKSFTWKDLLTPMFYIINGGLWLMLFIIFAETGLLVGFFFPGDSLLFVAGIFSDKLAASFYDTGNSFLNLLMVIALTAIAGILGNAAGYWFGKRIGPTMFHWKDNLIFKQKYLHQAHDFYEKHGGGAVVFARFVPIVRTFAPIVAGIVQMDQKKFTFFNITGCIAWVASMLAGGHYLDKFFLEHYHFDIKKHLEVIVIGIVLITTAPVIIKLVFGKVKPSVTPVK